MADSQEICLDGAFRIDRGGQWFHDGAPIGRARLVKLFAGVLVRDAAGAYWLQTPVEKVLVEVEDAPFVAVELAAEGAGAGQVLRLRTNVDAWVGLDAEHPLILRGGDRGPRPYVSLGGGLEALIARPVYYQLAALAGPGPEGEERLGVWSAGTFFPLGERDAADGAAAP